MRQRANLLESSKALSKRLSSDSSTLRECRLIVPGIVYPGVEISIGNFFFSVNKIYENVVFHLVENEVKVEPITSATMTSNPL